MATTIVAQPGSVYYTLPPACFGMKMTQYAGDMFPNADHTFGQAGRENFLTPDGKNIATILAEMKLHFFAPSMNGQGNPGGLSPFTPGGARTAKINYYNWALGAKIVLDAGGVLSFAYTMSVDTPGTTGTSRLPEDVLNVNAGDFSPANMIAWLNWWQSTVGIPLSKFRFAEAYNEPATMITTQAGGNQAWYGNPPLTAQVAGDRAEKFALNKHRIWFTDAFYSSFPAMVDGGSSYSEPGGPAYAVPNILRFLNGYAGDQANTSGGGQRNQDRVRALSVHSYGFGADGSQLGFPPADFQSGMNSYFYETYTNPSIVSGYKAGIDKIFADPSLAAANKARIKLWNTEWWAYGPAQVSPNKIPIAGIEGQKSALGDIVGLVVHCQNADVWKFDGLQYHAFNMYPVTADRIAGKPAYFASTATDAVIGTDSAGHIWRTKRYYAIKDFAVRFASLYPKLFRWTYSGPASPAGTRSNSVQTSKGGKIQPCMGLRLDNSSIGVCLINLGDTAETVTYQHPAASAAATGLVLQDGDVESPMAAITPTYTDGTKTAITVTVQPYSAVIIDIPQAPATVAPANTVLPTIVGTAQQGQTLDSTVGSWNNNPASFTYQWRRCNNVGGACADIAGATGPLYTAVAADIGSTLRLVVTATNAAGSSSATSLPTAIVSSAPPSGSAPVNTVLPVISGNALQGQTLSVTPGTWTNIPASFTYQWRRCDSSGGACSNIGGATGSTYVVQAGDVGSTIRCDVTATNASGSTVATAAPTVLVVAPIDTTAPVAVSATANADKVIVHQDDQMDPASVPPASAYAVSGGRTVTAPPQLSGQDIILTVSPPFANGDANPTVTYTAPV